MLGRLNLLSVSDGESDSDEDSVLGEELILVCELLIVRDAENKVANFGCAAKL